MYNHGNWTIVNNRPNYANRHRDLNACCGENVETTVFLTLKAKITTFGHFRYNDIYQNGALSVPNDPGVGGTGAAEGQL